MAAHQDKQAKLQEELDHYIKGKELSIESLKGLKYLRAVINESLRITPPASTTARIDYENDITLDDGLVIPKGTPIALPLATVLTDDKIWDNQDQFLPERFKEQGISTAFQFSPFGFAGGRVCPGKTLVGIETQFIIGTLLKNFKVTPNKNQDGLGILYLTATTPKDEVYVDITVRH